MRFVKILAVILALALVVLGIFAWTLPADVAYRHAAKYLGPLVLTGVRGNVWDGHADGASVFGRDLGELDWHARKAPLLQGRVVANLRISGADIDAAGEVALEGDGAMTASDLRFSVPASLLAPALDIGALKLLGTINGVLAHATLAHAMLRDATGTARWSDAGVSGEAEARFSDILAQFAAQPDGSIAGTVHDDGNGNLEVNGTFSARLDSFDAQAILRARKDDPQIAETLRYVGEPQADGSSKLVVHGQLLKVL